MLEDAGVVVEVDVVVVVAGADPVLNEYEASVGPDSLEVNKLEFAPQALIVYDVFHFSVDPPSPFVQKLNGCVACPHCHPFCIELPALSVRRNPKS